MYSNSAPVAYPAGIFFAAAVTTNLFVALIALICTVAYVFAQPAARLGRSFTVAFTDLTALAVGATALLVALGLHARANGGPFIFFEAQINVIPGGQFVKQPGYEWHRTEPRLLVPIFLLAAALRRAGYPDTEAGATHVSRGDILWSGPVRKTS
jgi:hypothetical protein